MNARGLIAAVLLTACTNDVRVGQPLRRVLDVQPDSPSALDVLFVVDASATAAGTRAQLVAGAGDALFTELRAQLGGTLPDLHVGVITTDVASSCDGAHDGAMHGGAAACPQVKGNYLIDSPNADGGRLGNYTGDLASAFACLVDVAPSTCQVSQPLAAVRAALAASPPAPNRGFLRDYAMLLVVFVTDRDDCSSDFSSFYSPGEFGSKPLDSRCFAESARCDGAGCTARDDGTLLAIPDVAAELRALKREPSMVMIAGIFAAPGQVALVDRGGGDLYPRSACAHREARPGLRLAALADQFTSRYAFASICDDGIADQLRHITRTVADVLTRSHCVLGPLPDRTPCRAFAETDTTRAPIPSCTSADSVSGGNCFRIAPAATCAATASTLAATASSPPPTGAHFVVECAAPPGL